MYFDFQALAAHAERLLDPFLTVDTEFLLKNVQGLLVARQADRTGRIQHTIDVGLRHFLVLDLDHPISVRTPDMAACNTGVYLAYLAVGHQLGITQRALNRRHRRIDVNHHALLHAGGFVHAHADHFQRPFRLDLGDDGDNLGSADVQPHN